MQMFFSTQKSLGDHAKISISITSLYFKIIKCRMAVKCRQGSHINL